MSQLFFVQTKDMDILRDLLHLKIKIVQKYRKSRNVRMVFLHHKLRKPSTQFYISVIRYETCPIVTKYAESGIINHIVHFK